MASIAVFVLALASCGQGSGGTSPDVSTGSIPIITRLDPATGAVGDTITIYGMGFSAAPELNLVLIGNSTAFANSYALVENPTADEIESITFTIPDGTAAGDNSVSVIVYENVSDPEILTVTQ